MSSIGRRSCEIIMKEKTSLSHKVVCFQMLLVLRSQNQIHGNKLLSQKLCYITMFYNTNSSLLTHYQVRLYANNYLSNYQLVSTAFKRNDINLMTGKNQKLGTFSKQLVSGLQLFSGKKKLWKLFSFCSRLRPLHACSIRGSFS